MRENTLYVRNVDVESAFPKRNVARREILLRLVSLLMNEFLEDAPLSKGLYNACVSGYNIVGMLKQAVFQTHSSSL